MENTKSVFEHLPGLFLALFSGIDHRAFQRRMAQVGVNQVQAPWIKTRKEWLGEPPSYR